MVSCRVAVEVVLAAGLVACGGPQPARAAATDSAGPRARARRTGFLKARCRRSPHLPVPRLKPRRRLGDFRLRDDSYATGRLSKKMFDCASGRAESEVEQPISLLNATPVVRFEGVWSHEIIAVMHYQTARPWSPRVRTAAASTSSGRATDGSYSGSPSKARNFPAAVGRATVCWSATVSGSSGLRATCRTDSSRADVSRSVSLLTPDTRVRQEATR